jgi:hypothetical protein
MASAGEFTVEIDDAALQAQLSHLNPTLKRAAAMAINDTGLLVKTGAQETLAGKGTNDTGNLSQHIFLDEATEGSLNATVRASTPYAAPVEKGSRPHFPPPAALVGWMSRKAHAADPERAAYALALKISREGTTEQPYMQPNYDKYVPGELLRRLKSACDAAMRSLK